MGPQKFTADFAVPKLRPDLRLYDAGEDISGAPGAIIEDPLRAKFFRMPGRATEMLPAWNLGKAGLIMQSTGATLAEIEKLFQFLEVNRLLQKPAGGFDALLRERDGGDQGLLKRILHGYLFFRVPLFDPTRFLNAFLPQARLLALPVVINAILFAGLVGLYFSFRQWDNFVASFASAISLEGAALFGVTLVILKIFHELGHAFVARHYGCRVPLIGVAFMVLTPMFFTEVSDAWRLKNRHERLRIAAAGVCIELLIACLAFFAWAFFPDGALRQAAFFVATTAWMTSVFVNLSPFMRFDGYHILGDLLGMYNHGPRAMALACWRIRKAVLGISEDPPEFLPRGLTRGLIGFAFGTMIYRATLFAGIALLVYHMFPKIFGIPLAAVEVIFFIALPIWREVSSWRAYGLRNLMQSIRLRMNMVFAVAAALLVCLPLDRSVSIPAVLMASDEAWLFTPENAAIAEVLTSDGAQVHKGDALLRLRSSQLEAEWEVTKQELAVADAKLRQTLDSQRALASLQSLEREKRALETKLRGLLNRRERLLLRAPVNGRVNAMLGRLKPGEPVGPADPLLHVAGTGPGQIIGLANERDAMRLEVGSDVRFISEDGAVGAVAASIGHFGIPGGSGPVYDYLSAASGGPITMARKSDGMMAPAIAVLPVAMSTGATAPARVIRGTVVADASGISLAQVVLGRVATILRRESGF